MSITWQKVKARVASALGTLEGADVSTQDTNYAAALSTSTMRGADWSPTEILDACVETVMELTADLIEAEHPDGATYYVISSALSSGDTLPTTSAGSMTRVGRIVRVKDATNSRSLTQTSVNKVRDFLASSSTVFNGYNAYWYAIDGESILHTRTTVNVYFGGFTRASTTVNIGGTDVIPIPDRYEAAIVAGSIARLAIQESQYVDLATMAAQEYAAARALIRTYQTPPDPQK